MFNPFRLKKPIVAETTINSLYLESILSPIPVGTDIKVRHRGTVEDKCDTVFKDSKSLIDFLRKHFLWYNSRGFVAHHKAYLDKNATRHNISLVEKGADYHYALITYSLSS